MNAIAFWIESLNLNSFNCGMIWILTEAYCINLRKQNLLCFSELMS